MKINSLSVFFPAYNEEGNITNTVTKAIKVLEKLNLKWEILIVDDGSRDQTGQIADELSRKYKNVRVIHQQNGGYGCALRTGFKNAKFDWVVYTDADGQFSFNEISQFIEMAPQADVLWGYRIKRSDPFIRLLFAKGWAYSLFFVLGLNFKDIDCGFKMLKKEVIDRIQPLESTRGAMINAEIAYKAKKAGFKIVQIGVNHYPRLEGKPTGANLKVIFKSYMDLFNLRLKLS